MQEGCDMPYLEDLCIELYSGMSYSPVGSEFNGNKSTKDIT